MGLYFDYLIPYTHYSYVKITLSKCQTSSTFSLKSPNLVPNAK